MTLRFFCGCFVIMMAVIQIAIYLSNTMSERLQENCEKE